MMPIQSINKLPNKAKQLYEHIYKQSKAKGSTDAKAGKVAWAVVKKNYVKKGDKYVEKTTVSEKSFKLNTVVNEKSLDGKTYLEGYILTFDPDQENEIMSPSFANEISEDLTVGGLYHINESNGLLIIRNKRVDDKGLFARVEVNKEHKYYDKAMQMIKDKPDNLAFSVRVATPSIGGKRIVEKGGKYYSEYITGKGIDFGLTDMPVNPNAKAKAL